MGYEFIMKTFLTQIRDKNSYSDIDSTKHNFDLNSQTLNDY